jgi:hypothetical protein
MDNDVASPAELEAPRLIPSPRDDARRRALERQRRAEAARIAALVQSMLHGRGGARGAD